MSRRPHLLRGLLKRLAKGLLYLLFLGLVVFGLLEMGVRLLAPQVLQHDVPDLWAPDAALGWRRRPHVHLHANTGERDVEICTDARGDRTACAAAPAHPCTRRILVLGDSFVEALAVPWPETAWARLEAATGACLQVAGVGGYGLAQYAAVAAERLSPGEPPVDTVILNLYVANDLTADPTRIPPPTEVQRRPFHLLPQGLSTSALRAWFYPINQWLETWSHAYVAVRAAIRRARDPGDAGLYGIPEAIQPSRFTPALLEGTVEGVRRIAARAAAAGARLIVVVIPFRNQATDPDGAALLEAYPDLRGDLDMALPQKRLLPALRALPGVRVVDLLPALRAAFKPTLWGQRDRHLSPEGHAIWARALEPLVRAPPHRAPLDATPSGK